MQPVQQQPLCGVYIARVDGDTPFRDPYLYCDMEGWARIADGRCAAEARPFVDGVLVARGSVPGLSTNIPLTIHSVERSSSPEI